MRKNLTKLALASAVGALLPLATPAAAQQADLDYELSRDMRSAAEQAQSAINQGNFPAASAALNQAAAATRTDGDRYVLASLQLDLANRTFNTAAQVAAINALLASPLLSAEQGAELYYHRARISYHAQNFQAARADLQAAIDRGAVNPRIFIAMSSLMDEGGDHANALLMVERALEIHRTAGIPTPEDWYRRAIHFAQEQNDLGKVVAFGRAMLAEHPSPRNWRDVLTLSRTAYAADPEAALDLWRLQNATGSLAGEIDYRDYARVTHGRSLPAETERLVQSGRAVNMLDGGNAEIAALDRGTTAAAQALRSALPGRGQAAMAAATGESAMDVANGYMSLGEYAAAVPFYRAAIEKGSIDTGLANIRLGQALALSGNGAEAQTALAQVTGPRASVAGLWWIYASQPQVAVSAAEPTTTPDS